MRVCVDVRVILADPYIRWNGDINLQFAQAIALDGLHWQPNWLPRVLGVGGHREVISRK